MSDTTVNSVFDLIADVSPCRTVSRTVKQSETVLEEAARIVASDRGHHYGHPAVNHARTAALWSVYVGKDITAEDVCMLNILQKAARGMNELTRDCLVDIAGYAQNVAMIREYSPDESP